MLRSERTLFNPGEPSGGAPSTPAGGPPTQGPPPAPAPAAPSHPDFGKAPAAPGEARPAQVYLSPDEWQSTQAELAALRTFQTTVKAELEAKEAERVQALAAKGQVQEAFELTRQQNEAKLAEATGKAATLQERWLGERRDNALNEALAGVTFSGADPRATAAMVRQLLAGEVEATLVDGNPVVRHRLTLRPAIDHLRERLASPEFAIFLAPSSRGGSGAGEARPAAFGEGNREDPNKAFAAAYRARLAAQEALRH